VASTASLHSRDHESHVQAAESTRTQNQEHFWLASKPPKPLQVWEAVEARLGEAQAGCGEKVASTHTYHDHAFDQSGMSLMLPLPPATTLPVHLSTLGFLIVAQFVGSIFRSFDDFR
jgi:hypothetical protein